MLSMKNPKSLIAFMNVAAVVVASTLSVAAVAAAPPTFVSAAVADASRPAEDRQRDADRKPAELVAFAGIKRGASVLELVPGGGYFTRILSQAIGPKGQLYTLSPAPRPDAPANAPDRAAPIKAIAADPHYANVKLLIQPIKKLDLPAKLDLVWTTLNYHDIHNVPDIDLLAFNKAIYSALKPGGVYFVIDHTAAADAAADVTSKLHRINPEVVKTEVLAAGFVLEAQSDLLKHPADPHTAAVFDASIRGKTDQFVFKFRKHTK